MAIVTNQTIYTGTLDDDSIGGTTGNDSLAGAAGNDTLKGLGGDDALTGNSGRDVAEYSGSASDYKVSRNAQGLWTVSDQMAADGDEGQDTLVGIETLRFADTDYRIGAAYAPVGSEFKVNTTTSEGQTYPSITALADGGFVVTWMSEAQDGSGWGIYGQRYTVDGAASGSEFLTAFDSVDAFNTAIGGSAVLVA